MRKQILQIVAFIFTVSNLNSQVLIDDFQVNNSAFNLKGLGRTAIAANNDGGFAVAWQDYNDYNNPIPAMPRVAVQLFTSNAAPVGPLNFFNGETRAAIIYLDDYLTGNIDLEFLPTGNLLVAVQHEGLFDNLVTQVWSWESGIGAVSPAGQIIDLLGGSGVISWLFPFALVDNGNLRIAATPAGNFFGVLNGPSYETDRSGVLIQQFDVNANLAGDYFTPHTNDPGPNYNHFFPDIGTNGNIHIVVWQDGRLDANYDISAQFYNNEAPIGENLQVNSGDPAGTINGWPSVDMNANGRSVIVWADTRTTADGEIFGQIFDSNMHPVGGNFQVSGNQGRIIDRPELAVLNDGSFMVVWTDSLLSVSGEAAYRARGRQFNANGTPAGNTFIIPNQDIASGLTNIGTDGTDYYLSWLDHRKGEIYSNLFAKKISSAATAISLTTKKPPTEIVLDEPYPNPFNSSTTIRFFLPRLSNIRIEIYNIIGEKIKTLSNEISEPGEHVITLDATDFSSGIYLLRFYAEDIIITKKLFVTK